MSSAVNLLALSRPRPHVTMLST